MSANGDDHALVDVTNKVSSVQLNEVALERVKEANWGTRQEYDYAKYTAGPHDKTALASEVDQPDAPSWAANAAKYEWNDEYGDIGPDHDVLKEMLFSGDHQMKQGDEFSK